MNKFGMGGCVFTYLFHISPDDMSYLINISNLIGTMQLRLGDNFRPLFYFLALRVLFG